MKKYLLTIILSALTLIGFCQTWNKNHYIGDEMKGKVSYDAYSYLNDKGEMFVYWTCEPCFRVCCAGYTTDVNNDEKQAAGYMDGKVGLYDLNNKLIKMLNVKMFFPINRVGYVDCDASAKAAAQEIIDYLRNNKGFVRCVFPMYQGADMDFKVPCFRNIR